MSATKILWGQVLVVFAIVLGAVWGATQWTAQALAYRLIAGPPLALAAARRLLYAGQTSTFDEALNAECEAQVGMLTSRDFGEGVAAWFERRPPRFTGE